MILISNLTLNIKDGSTIASTEIYGVKTYVNTGSGNVFNLDWETPALTDDDSIDRYSLVIKRYDPTLNVYYDIFNKNIGQVNVFYADSSMLPAELEQYMLSVYLVAYGKHGSVVTSDVINPYVIKGSGTYVKVIEDDYAEPIMKRALGFVNTMQTVATVMPMPLTLTDCDGETLIDVDEKALSAVAEPVEAPLLALADSEGYVLTYSDGRVIAPKAVAALLNREGLQFVDVAGRSLFAHSSPVLNNTSGWSIVQKGYTKDATGTWRINDIMYEALQVLNENGEYEVLMEQNGLSPIYIL